MKTYKLLVLDLDGTLTNEKKEITPRTKQRLLKAQEKGVKIVLASGRPTYGIAPLADELELQHFGGFILSYNGGEIINWQTKELMYESILPDEFIPYLYQCSVKSGFPILTYEDKYVITEHPEDEFVLHEAFINKMPIKKVDNFLKAIHHPITKCLIVGNEQGLESLEKEMQQEVGEKMGVFRSAPFFLELVPKGIDKALSLAVLLKALNMQQKEMIACGDGFNDLSMIKYAGLGVAMENAQPIVKEHADYITSSNEAEGVAAVIDKFILTD